MTTLDDGLGLLRQRYQALMQYEDSQSHLLKVCRLGHGAAVPRPRLFRFSSVAMFPPFFALVALSLLLTKAPAQGPIRV